MSEYADDYLDAINEGTIDPDEVSLAEYTEWIENAAKVEAASPVAVKDVPALPASGTAPLDEIYPGPGTITLATVFTYHSLEKTHAGTMSVARIQEFPGGKQVVTGIEYGTRRVVVVTIEHPEL